MIFNLKVNELSYNEIKNQAPESVVADYFETIPVYGIDYQIYTYIHSCYGIDQINLIYLTNSIIVSWIFIKNTAAIP